MMTRYDCMRALAARLSDELVILSLGAASTSGTTRPRTCERRACSSNSWAA